MKYLTAIILAAGLASAANVATPVVRRQEAEAAASTEASEATSSESAAQVESVANIVNGTGLDANVTDSQLSSGSFGNFGGNLNIDGLNLGNVNLSNQNDLINAILAMMNALCLGGLFNFNNIANLGGNVNLQLFAQLAQLMQLQQLGFLNLGDIQSLILGGFGINNFNGFNNFNGLNGLNLLNGLQGFGGFNSFNFGTFKRAVDEHKKTMKRTKLRRTPEVALSKRQCQAVGANAGSVVATETAATTASVASEAATQTAASESAAAATETPLADSTR